MWALTDAAEVMFRRLFLINANTISMLPTETLLTLKHKDGETAPVMLPYAYYLNHEAFIFKGAT